MTLDAEYNQKAQQAALMMAANNTLSHFPPNTFKCFTAPGAEGASKSNLALGSYGSRAITRYIEDSGTNNASVGHRRWLLYPQTLRMGTGDVKTSANSGANAVWVAPNQYEKRPNVRDEFIAYPAPGFAPYPLLFERWSFSYPNADFSNATVAMKTAKDNQMLNVQIETIESKDYIGDSSLVWVPAITKSSTLPQQDTTYQVVIDNVKINGVARKFTYEVTAINPEVTGQDTVLPKVSNWGSNTYVSNYVPNAERYQLERINLGNLFSDDAENGINNFIVDTNPGYSLTSSVFSASGKYSFHLTQPKNDEYDWSTQTLTLKNAFVVKKNAQLRFASLLRYSSEAQFAKVQVSSDEGINWRDIFFKTGSNLNGISFTTQTISLAAYEGKLVKLRFQYGHDWSLGYYMPYLGDAGYGWYIDDIKLDNMPIALQRNSVESNTPIFQLSPGAAEATALHARALAFSDYPLEWGDFCFDNCQTSNALEPQLTSSTANQALQASTRLNLSLQVMSLAPLQNNQAWALIKAPNQQSSSTNELVKVLLPCTSQGNNQYLCQADYAKFDAEGDYQVSFYAQDTQGRVSTPRPPITLTQSALEPQITPLTANRALQTNTRLNLSLQVMSLAPLQNSQAWALIKAPNQQSSSTNELVKVLLPCTSQGNNQYLCQADYAKFDAEGDYEVSFYTQDTQGRTSKATPPITLTQSLAAEDPAIYDSVNQTLRLLDVIASGIHYEVTFKYQDNQFTLLSADFARKLIKSAAQYDANSQTLTINKVVASKIQYQATLKHIGNYAFTLADLKVLKGSIGPAGGIVFYVDNSGLHGLEAQPFDYKSGELLTWQDALTAAGSYGLDWRLPSKEELNNLYLNRNFVGNFNTDLYLAYWSSTNSQCNDCVWSQSFRAGEQKETWRGIGNPLGSSLYVRAVHSF